MTDNKRGELRGIAAATIPAQNGSMQRYAPDTNFYLQFKPPHELPWSELTDASVIELIVLSEVLHELDNHKNGGNERRARRARHTLQTIRPLILGEAEEVVVRERAPRVVYRLAPLLQSNRDKPSTLDTNKADGRIVEESLACQAIIGDVTLLTHDSLPMLTARTHGLRCKPLPDHWRLQPETDSKDKEIARLKGELEAWQKRAPAIAVRVLMGGVPTERIEGTLRRYAPPTDKFLQRAMEAVLLRHPRETARNLLGQSPFLADNATDYAAERNKWETKLHDRLRCYTEILNVREAMLPLQLVLENQGAASAEGLVVEVFAEGAVCLADPEATEELVKKLDVSLAQPPRMSRTLDVLGRLVEQRFESPLVRAPYEGLLKHIKGPPGRDFEWSFDEPEVMSERLEGSCGDFRHGIHRENVAVAVRMPIDATGEVEGSLRVRYSARNLNEPTERVWPVRLACNWCDAEEALTKLVKEQLDVIL